MGQQRPQNLTNEPRKKYSGNVALKDILGPGLDRVGACPERERQGPSFLCYGRATVAKNETRKSRKSPQVRTALEVHGQPDWTSRGTPRTHRREPVPLSKVGTRLLASLGSNGKKRNSLACLRNAGSYSAMTYCRAIKLCERACTSALAGCTPSPPLSLLYLTISSEAKVPKPRSQNLLSPSWWSSVLMVLDGRIRSVGFQ